MRDTIKMKVLRRYLFGIVILWLIVGQCGIILAAEPNPRFTVEGFVVEGENPLSQKETRKILEPFIGEHEGLEGLEDASRALQDLLSSKGYNFHRVIVPPQRATGGVFKLQIITFEIDRVTVEGNKYYSSDNILSSLPMLRAGWTPNSREIARSLMVANEHPSKYLSVFLKEGKTPGRIDARVEARDSRPYQFFHAFSNTGNRETGHYRWSLGYQQSNLFDLDHTMTLSYTTSPGNWDDVGQYGGYYRIPLYEQGAGLTMFYTHSRVDQGTIADFFEVSGKGTFYGASFDYALYPLQDYNHKLHFGLQDKLFDNNISVIGGAPFGVDVRSRPLSLRYTGRLQKPRLNGELYIEYLRNVSWGSNNNLISYSANRAGADSHWDAIRYGGNLDYSLPQNYLLRFRFDVQLATEPLISGEQFGLGGINSIRGFEEREVSGDLGQQLNFEVWTPPLDYNIRLLGFVDAGKWWIVDQIPGQNRRDSLLSFGLGARWQWKDIIRVSVDLAHVASGSDISETASGDEKIHFSLSYRF